MGMNSAPTFASEEKSPQEKFINEIKSRAMFIDNLYLPGNKTPGDVEDNLPGTSINMNNLSMKPLTWNENQGVIIFSDENGEKYAIPGTSEIRDSFFKAEITKDESIGVPALNGDVWGTPEQRKSSYAREQWLKLLEQVK